MLYTCSAWSGFITASDRHRVDAFLRRSKRSGYCQLDLPSFDELLEDADDKLFNKICNNLQHSLHYLLPNVASQITISVPLHLTTDNYLHTPDT